MASELVLEHYCPGCQVPPFLVTAVVMQDTPLMGAPRERVVVDLTVTRNRHGGTGHIFEIETSNGYPVDKTRGWDALKDWMLETLESDDA